jgi:hypothetical protein
VYKDRIKVNENGVEKKIPTEYHIGGLEEKVTLKPTPDVKEEINIRKIGDYSLDFTKLIESIKRAKDKIERIEYCLSPEFEKLYCVDLFSNLKAEIGAEKVVNLDIDRLG